MSTTTKNMKAKRSASALVLVVLAIVVLALIGTGLLRIGLNSHIFAIRNSRMIAARSAADAGLAKAIYDLNQKLDVGPWTNSGLPSATNETLPNASSVFTYQITELDGTYPDYSYRIKSTGKAGFATKIVYSTTKIRSLFDYAIFVKNDLILKAGTTVTGFDSSDPTNTDVNVQIGTNSTEKDAVVLVKGVTVNGDVFVGAGGDTDDVIKNTGGVVTGGEYASANEEFILPVVPDDVFPWYEEWGDLEIKGPNEPNITEHDNGEYVNVTIEKKAGENGVLVVESGNNVVMHITGDMEMKQGCEVFIEAGASLTIYIAGDLISGNNSGFFSVDNTATLKIFGIATDSQSFDIKAKSSFYGQIYAPNAEVIIKAQGDLYGAFVADSFEVKSNGDIYYDLALSFVNINDPGARFAINRWYE